MGKMWMVFVVGAALSWGTYGPLMHNGQVALGSPIRAFLCVGIAYFLLAVLVPGAILVIQEEPGQFTTTGTGWGLAAGTVGAIGACCVIFAFRSGGSPIYVMPLIFGGAPIVNTIVAMIQHRPTTMPDFRFFLGIVMAGVAAYLILRFKPA